ncbi:MAG: hypothetical protein JOZ49_19395 [Mycolicibacterium sp.]|nr:hypothetical protein [Mycolicibacterium sp.]
MSQDFELPAVLNELLYGNEVRAGSAVMQTALADSCGLSADSAPRLTSG